MSAPTPPAWLPAVIPFSGDWDAFIRTLYAIFEADFKRGVPRFHTCPVWHDQRVLPDGSGKEEGFWHLVTGDKWVWNPATRRNEKERLPDIARAGRLPWARPIIGHETDAAVLAWDFDEETKYGLVVRTYVWLKEHDYLVILERQPRTKGDVFMLITSFFVTYEGKRRDLQSRHDRRRK